MLPIDVFLYSYNSVVYYTVLAEAYYPGFLTSMSPGSRSFVLPDCRRLFSNKGPVHTLLVLFTYCTGSSH